MRFNPLFGLFLTAFCAACAAHADPVASQKVDLSGTHRGETVADHRRVELMVRSLESENRPGSYMAILFQPEPMKIAAYLIDPMSGNQFIMVPRVVTPDGLLVGNKSRDPSLVLTYDGVINGHVRMSITNANPSKVPKDEFPAIQFDDKKAEFEWTDLQPGEYRVEGSENKANIPRYLDDGEASVAFTFELPNLKLNGQYLLSDDAPGIFTLRGVAVTGAGKVVEAHPKKLGVFIKSRHDDYFFMIDPDSRTNVTRLKRK